MPFISGVRSACRPAFAAPSRLGGASLGRGLLLATDRRFAFIANDEARYLPYSAIERVERGKSLLGAYVSLYTRGHQVRVKWINSRRVRPFVRTVRGAFAGPAAAALAVERAGCR